MLKGGVAGETWEISPLGLDAIPIPGLG